MTMPSEKEPESTAEAEPEKGPQWEKREQFRITGQMQEVIGKTVVVAEQELKALHRKLQKLTYGS